MATTTFSSDDRSSSSARMFVVVRVRMVLMAMVILLLLMQLEPVSSSPSTSSPQQQQVLDNTPNSNGSSNLRSLRRSAVSASTSVLDAGDADPSSSQQQQQQQSPRTLQQQQVDQYQKCYDTIDDIVGNDDTDTDAPSSVMTQDDYVLFLRAISGGRVQATQFSELSTVFVLLFYSAACTGGRNCVNKDDDNTSPPAVSLQNRGSDSNWQLLLLCRQVLTYTYSSVDNLTFEYTVRYDTAVTTAERVETCLAMATQNLLLDQVAQCAASSRRMLSKKRDDDEIMKDPDPLPFWQEHGSPELLVWTQDFVSTKDATRLLQHPHQQQQHAAGSSTTSMSSSNVDHHRHLQTKNNNRDCSYTVEVQIRGLSDLACNDPTPITTDDGDSSSSSNGIQCALVRSSAIVVAEQLVEPHAGDLRRKIVNTLRQAINNNTNNSSSPALEAYLPEGCLLNNNNNDNN